MLSVCCVFRSLPVLASGGMLSLMNNYAAASSFGNATSPVNGRAFSSANSPGALDLYGGPGGGGGPGGAGSATVDGFSYLQTANAAQAQLGYSAIGVRKWKCVHVFL